MFLLFVNPQVKKSYHNKMDLHLSLTDKEVSPWSGIIFLKKDA